MSQHRIGRPEDIIVHEREDLSLRSLNPQRHLLALVAVGSSDDRDFGCTGTDVANKVEHEAQVAFDGHDDDLARKVLQNEGQCPGEGLGGVYGRNDDAHVVREDCRVGEQCKGLVLPCQFMCKKVIVCEVQPVDHLLELHGAWVDSASYTYQKAASITEAIMRS